jgi:hypothetical protein
MGCRTFESSMRIRVFVLPGQVCSDQISATGTSVAAGTYVHSCTRAAFTACPSTPPCYLPAAGCYDICYARRCEPHTIWGRTPPMQQPRPCPPRPMHTASFLQVTAHWQRCLTTKNRCCCCCCCCCCYSPTDTIPTCLVGRCVGQHPAVGPPI